MEKPLFFCTGIPKSGTTLLQQIIRYHPHLSCPAEQHVDWFLHQLKSLYEQYNTGIINNDRDTARQGAPTLDQSDLIGVWKTWVHLIFTRFSTSKQAKALGIKDNDVFGKLGFYLTHFPESKFICILRDPREITVSSWHHNRRVDPDFAGTYQSLSEWGQKVGKTWAIHVDQFIQIQQLPIAKTQILPIRYEDLIQNPAQQVTTLFEFLGVSTDPSLVSTICQKTRFKKTANNPFYRQGKTASWTAELPPKAADQILEIAGSAAQHFGYTTQVPTQ